MSSSRTGLYVIILFMGLISSLMIYFNGVLAGFSGLYLVSLVVHLVGLGPAFLMFLLFDWDRKGFWGPTFSRSKYLFTAGFIGAVSVVMSAYCINASGVFITSIAMTVGQFILSLIIDLKGYFGFPKIRLNTSKTLAIVLIIAGSIMISI